MSLIGLLTATEKQAHLRRLHMRPIQWHLKNNWRVPEWLDKVIPVPRSRHPHVRWSLEDSNVLPDQPLHPLKHARQIFTDASKEGWGVHLDEHTARGTWSLAESKLHINHLELKAVFLAVKEFRTLCCNKTVLIATDNTTVVAYVNKGGDEVGLSVCPTVENPVMVHQAAGNPQGTSHPRLAKHDSRQAIQAWPDRSNRVVTLSRSVPSYMLLVASVSSGLVCHQVQQQTPIVCVTGPRPTGMGSGCTQTFLGGPGPMRLSTSSHLGQSGGEAAGLPLQQDNPDCPRVAQHALVPDLSMRQSGPFLQSGASVIRWTSGHHLWKPLLMATDQPLLTNSSIPLMSARMRISLVSWTVSIETDPKADQSLLTNWAIPLMSARMRISLVSWTVSIETDPRAEGASPPGTLLIKFAILFFAHTFYTLTVNLVLYFWLPFAGHNFCVIFFFHFLLWNSLHSHLTQSPFMGTDCLF